MKQKIKLRDLFDRVNKKNLIDYVNIEDIATDLNIHDLYHSPDQTRLTAYFLGSWQCTDTQVGYRLYFFDEKPAAFSFQGGRKSDEDLQWVAKDIRDEVKAFILSLVDDPDNSSYIDLDTPIDPFYKVQYIEQLYKEHEEFAYYNGEKIEVIKYTKGDSGLLRDEMATIRLANGEIANVNLNMIDYHFDLVDNSR